MKSWLLESLKNGAIVITPTERLASHIISHYFSHQPATVIEKPRCFSYKNWLISYFHQVEKTPKIKKPPLLLSPYQSHFLWKMVLNEAGLTYLSDNLITKVEQAWNLLNQYDLNLECFSFLKTEETAAFQKWARAFFQKLTALSFITETEIARWLIEANVLPSSKTLIFYCFDALTPQQKKLLQHLKTQGISIFEMELVPKEHRAWAYHAPDETSEMQAMIAWADEKLQNGATSLGIVCPNLAEKQIKLRRVLKQSFKDTCFHLSTGQPLSKHPLVSHALVFLSLNKDPIELNLLKLLLTSPYLKNGNSEFEARSSCFSHEKLMGQENICFNEAIHEIASIAPKFALLLKTLPPLPNKASPTTFKRLYLDRLQHLGFPGDHSLTSETWQCFQHFIVLLEQFASLTAIVSSLSQEKALKTLEMLANNTTFQVENTKAPLQIMGLLESAGTEFDALWVMGVNEEVFPAEGLHSPFLPQKLQVEKNLPYANPEHEWALSQIRFSRLSNMAPHIIFSVPLLLNGIPNHPSIFLSHLPLQPSIPPKKTLLATPFIVVSDPDIIPLSPLEEKKGGASLLAYQSTCPFRAFSRYRLYLTPLPTEEKGLSAKIKGQIMHRVLEMIWKTLKDQTTLLSETHTTLDAMIQTSISEALSHQACQHIFKNKPMLKAIETKRLTKLITKALIEEKKRSPFKVVALEKTMTLLLDELVLTLRIDRMDETETGNFIIDYKSTRPTSLPFKQDRPKAPQLLLYALLDKAITTLTYVELKAHEIDWVGFSETPHNFKNIRPIKPEETWKDHQKKWEKILLNLAKEYLDGNMTISPQTEAICTTCEFQNVCKKNFHY